MIDYDDYEIKPSKHFVMDYMRKWGFDIEDIRETLKKAYKLDKVGKIKYEAYSRIRSNSKKIIFVVYEDEKQIFIISGAEGKWELVKNVKRDI